jgi:hypothetical protein
VKKRKMRRKKEQRERKRERNREIERERGVCESMRYVFIEREREEEVWPLYTLLFVF